MRNVFELTRQEQRVVILIVALLVSVAFARHVWQGKSSPLTGTKSLPVATPSASNDKDNSGD
jgi:hypothetical protein